MFVNVSMLGKEKTYDTAAQPVTVLNAVEDLTPEYKNTALGCFCGGRALELNQVLGEDCALHPITFRNEEGRRIYERTLRFVLLLAVKRVLGDGCRVRIEHSIGYGVYMRFLGRDADEKTVAAVEREMREIVKENLPFTQEKWSRDEAIRHFAMHGMTEKAHLLAFRPYDYFHIYRCGGMAEYFYGAMLPSTGYVSAFRLLYHEPGMVLQMPSPVNPGLPAPFEERKKHLAVFAQSNRWLDILDCKNAADLNDMTVGGKLREFIRINEALHDKSIAEIADGIEKKGARAVFVAGPSSSGKTTFSNRLCIHLRVLGKKPVLISLDDFYRDQHTLPLEADGKPDLEALTALDVDYFRLCMQKLLSGEEAQMPAFDFTTKCRKPVLKPLQLAEGQIVVIEGIHGLNPQMHEGLDPERIAKVYISELTCLNLDNHNRIRTTDARLLRRIVRDHQFRATLPEDTLKMWNSVRRGEEKWIFPYQEKADFMFNSALHYELPVLKKYAYDLLMQIPPENECYLAARRLIKILHYLVPAADEVLQEIPPLSLLREFIGGCTFY
ncbi:MAG: nucleoside kinase [Clostridia bacterium]|nr:nucleoside kinase [Clostridia bacterium]